MPPDVKSCGIVVSPNVEHAALSNQQQHRQKIYIQNTSDVNKDWTHKDQDKDKDQSHKDKDKD